MDLPASKFNENPSPRIDPGERPRIRAGVEKKEQQAELNIKKVRSHCKKTLIFFPWRHTTAGKRESRMTEAEIRRPKAG